MKKLIAFLTLSFICVFAFAQLADSTKTQIKGIGGYLPANIAIVLGGLIIAYEVLAFAIPTWGNPTITKQISKVVFVIAKVLDGFSEFFNRKKIG